ncbi:sensor histidine kinase [Hyphomicrobium sp.]|uniref:sensor histidine kinase n=1 Tax=Hyphomicrobium sp. TaxID=82 RepID=UPI002E3407AC|nr:histidine kinase [Hyphomicrobium sp.]HEX2842695.1 histidine kinase [Hyphomicrobium sp.]
MNLLAHLIARLIAVVLLCLIGAIGWIMVDAHRTIERETAASADRMGRHLEALYWQKLVWRGGMSRDTILPLPDWETLSTLTVIAPGVCVSFAPPGNEPRKLCSQIEALGPPPPSWFVHVYTSLLGTHKPVIRALSVRDESGGTYSTVADPDAALRQSWGRVSVIAAVASALAAGIAVLAVLMIGRTLKPAGTIIQGLRELQKGNNAFRLPRFRAAEFDHIAYAVNDLAEDLSRTNAARAALTTRLLQVQEDERRALARDLHDEFGQSLTATVALAALIESSAPAGQGDIAEDARKIAAVQKSMMETLRSTLVRLRSQSIEEIGLEASLRQLVSDYNMQSASQTAFRLNVIGQMAAVPKQVAIDIYRIAQECLTNAVKHGTPTEVRLKVEYMAHDSQAIALSVEDDGGGDARRIKRDRGHGLLGIGERISALGGKLQIGNAASGIRITAIIPIFGSNNAGIEPVPA